MTAVVCSSVKDYVTVDRLLNFNEHISHLCKQPPNAFWLDSQDMSIYAFCEVILWLRQ